MNWNKKHLHSTDLMNAVLEGYETIVRELLAAKADVNTQDLNGETALHYAPIHKGTNCIPILLEAGAKLNVEAHNGNTPIDNAMIHKNWDALEILLDAGARIKIPKDSTYYAPCYARLFAQRIGV